MNPDLLKELGAAIQSDRPLSEVVAMLRRYKERGIPQEAVYSILVQLRQAVPDEETDDRILEVADFVAGFCAPHMRIWEEEMPEPTRG